jgi:hypothetical protein
LTITPTPSSTSFSYTYNPYLVGTKLITLTSSSTDIGGTTQAFASAATDASTFTCGAAATCNFGAAASWTCTGCASHNTPDTGDTLVVTGGHVVVPAGVSAAIGTCPANSTNLDVTLTPSGTNNASLEIAGTGKLQLCGNMKFNAPTSISPTSYGILQLNTGAELDIDQNQNASVIYKMWPANANGPNQFLVGTVGDVCTLPTGPCPTVIKAVNKGSVNFQLEAPVVDGLAMKIYGAYIADCGNGAIPCLSFGVANPNSNFVDIDRLDIRNSVFQRTNGVSLIAAANLGNKLKMNISDNRFINDLGGFLAKSSNVNLSTVTSCSVVRNYFDQTVGQGNFALGPCQWDGNVFARQMTVSAWGWSSFVGNVYVNPDGLNDFPQNSLLTTPWPGVSRTVILYTFQVAANQSKHIFNTPTSNLYMTKQLCLAVGGGSEGHCANQAQGGSARWQVVRDNLSLPTTVGQVNSGEWQIYDSMASMANLRFDHNGMYGQPDIHWGVGLGHAPNFPSNTVLLSYRSNVHWSPVPGAYNNSATGAYAVSYSGGTNIDTAWPANGMNAANVGYNGFWNATNSTDFATGTGTTNCNAAPGSTSTGHPYNVCTTVGTPGSGDVTGDPKLLDKTRNPLTWAQRLHGADGTTAGYLAYLQTCPDISQCIEASRIWVARGFQPTNLLYKGAAHDGTIIGFSGSFGSGYTGSCSVTVTPTGPPSGDDLGHDFAATCVVIGGVPQITITNQGANYRIASPATVSIGGSCTGGCVPASLVPIISPHDLGPADAQMAILPSAM